MDLDGLIASLPDVDTIDDGIIRDVARGGHDLGFHRGVRAAIAALYYQAGHLDAVADDLRRRDKCGYAATCERKASRLVMAAMSLEHVRSVAYQDGVA